MRHGGGHTIPLIFLVIEKSFKRKIPRGSSLTLGAHKEPLCIRIMSYNYELRIQIVIDKGEGFESKDTFILITIDASLSDLLANVYLILILERNIVFFKLFN